MSRDTERVEIRDAGFDDVREIQRVARTTWDHTYCESTPESLRREFVSQAYSTDSLRRRMEPNVFLVAAEGEEILGFADFRPRSGTQAELAAIYVLPEMQGRGSERASSQPASAGSRPLRDSCCGWSRTTHRPNASTRPTGSGASRSMRRSSTDTWFTRSKCACTPRSPPLGPFQGND